MKSNPLWLAPIALVLAACGAPAPSVTPDPVAAPGPQSVPSASEAPLDGLQPVGDDRPVIVFLGDSLTAGFDIPIDQALPEQVAAQLSRRGVAIEAVNAGVSGDTTANGLARYDWSVAAAKPDLLVIALGANDYLLDLSPDLTRQNLSDLIERAQAERVPVILAGIAPRTDAAPGSRDAAFAAIYPDLAAKYDVPLLPALLSGVRDNPALLLADGIHPTADGVTIMAGNLAPLIAAALSDHETATPDGTPAP